MKIKISKGERIFRIFNYLLISFLAIICFYPFWHVIVASLCDGREIISLVRMQRCHLE